MLADLTAPSPIADLAQPSRGREGVVVVGGFDRSVPIADLAQRSRDREGVVVVSGLDRSLSIAALCWGGSVRGGFSSGVEGGYQG